MKYANLANCKYSGKCLLILFLLFAFSSQVRTQDNSGQILFEEQCAACHTIGQGDLVGPDLQNITEIRDRDWLKRFIIEPDQILAEGDPIAQKLLQQYNEMEMPNLGITSEQADAILAFITNQSTQTKDQKTAAAASPKTTTNAGAVQIEGDVAIGKELFTGKRKLTNGGPACFSCHNITGVGKLGGGRLGLDLTQAYSKFGDAGITSILSNLPFPTMQPIYANRQLTPQEQAHLKVLFEDSAQVQPRKNTIEVTLLAGAGFILMLLIAPSVWRNRLQGMMRETLQKRKQNST